MYKPSIYFNKRSITITAKGKIRSEAKITALYYKFKEQI